MKYLIYKYVATVIDGESIDLELGASDENGELHSFTLLEKLRMKENGDEFTVGNLQLASFTNFQIDDNVIKLEDPADYEKATAILHTISFIQENGFTALLDVAPRNPREQRYFENKERIVNKVNVAEVKILK